MFPVNKSSVPPWTEGREEMEKFVLKTSIAKERMVQPHREVVLLIERDTWPVCSSKIDLDLPTATEVDFEVRPLATRILQVSTAKNVDQETPVWQFAAACSPNDQQ